MTDDEVVGQMSTLLFAASDTTSSAVARILHQLALNQDVQTRLRQEIRSLVQERKALVRGDSDYVEREKDILTVLVSENEKAPEGEKND